jgi:hypothetical protein
MTALVGSTSVLLAGCGGSSTSATSTASAASVDDCLVGTWTTAALTESSPANDETITYSGGAGEVFTITAQGVATIDTHAAQPVHFVSAPETFTATVTGTGHATVSTLAGGTLLYEPSDGDTLATTVVDDATGLALGPPKPDLAFAADYTCTRGQSFTFYKTTVTYMIDGPKVTLTAGNSSS